MLCSLLNSSNSRVLNKKKLAVFREIVVNIFFANNSKSFHLNKNLPDTIKLR